MSFSKGRVLAVSAFLLTSTAAVADDNVMVVFDGSNSMWGQIDGVAKIEIARDVMDNLLGDWAEDRNVGLMAYGHRTRGDCSDIEVLVQPGEAQRNDILTRIKSITPTGKTPLTDAVEQAATQLSYTDRPATVVLISDGLESCDRDPCALARALEQGGVGFTAHVVGFGLGNEEDTASLSCIAEETGGQYIQASNADELGAALSAVATAVADPEPETPEVTVDGPGTATGGAAIRVTWTPTVKPGDRLTVVPVGSDPGTLTQYAIAGDADEVFLKVPGDEGLYEVRYVSVDTGDTLGFEPLEVSKPQVDITAPGQALAGAQVKVAWTPTINSADRLSIVPAGSAPGTLGTYQIAGDETEMLLPIGGEPGLYEVRYILSVDQRTVASHPIEAILPEVTLQAPDQVLTGEQFAFSWAGTVNSGDYLTLVPASAEDETLAGYVVAGDKSDATLTAPSETGIYELRYVLREGKRVLARETIEVTLPEATVSGPETAFTGERFKVSWTGTVNDNDFVTIVPVGAEPGTYLSYVRVRDDSEGFLVAPADTGLYELRYVLSTGKKVLATAAIEVTAPDVTVAGPETVVTGASFQVSWSRSVNKNDYVTIVPVGAEANAYTSYVRVKDNNEGSIVAPAEPGLYELRYVLEAGKKVMATAAIEVTDPEVTLSGPETVFIGAPFRVSWTGNVHKQDYVTIVPVGADSKTYNSYVRVKEDSAGSIVAPAEPGLYEIRYMLDNGKKVLASAPIEVTVPTVTVSAPESVSTGASFKVNWTGNVHPNDYVTIVPAGSEEKAYADYKRVREKTEDMLTAPAEAGLYEVRYVLDNGKKVMAKTMVEVAVPEVELEAPSEIRAGDVLQFTWSGAVNAADYITLVPMGTPDDKSGDYIRVRENATDKLKAPATTGLYELRYVLNAGKRVMARVPVEVLAEDAALNTGAALSAPETGAPGSTIEVTWKVDNDSADQRISLARGNQAIFTWIEAVKIKDATSVQITLPKETGVYELRFLDVANQAVLARKVIKVE
ncbi:MAG: VWA domain-containing protein [Pseudomonadota bacterium]